jgi:hypothetical protein
LRGDGVTQSSGDIAAIHFILGNFKNDFAHGNILSGLFAPGKHPTVMAVSWFAVERGGVGDQPQHAAKFGGA